MISVATIPFCHCSNRPDINQWVWLWSRGPSGWLRGKGSICQCRSHTFGPWVQKIPRGRKWQPTPILLPGKTPWTEEPGGLQSIVLQRIRHSLATKTAQQYVYIIMDIIKTSFKDPNPFFLNSINAVRYF